MSPKFKNDVRLMAIIDKIPEGERLEALQDAVNSINGYIPKAFQEGASRRLSNSEVRTYIATEGHNPEKLPDIILRMPDMALVREIDRSCYYRLVNEKGFWFCGCNNNPCIHKEVLRMRLREREAKSHV